MAYGLLWLMGSLVFVGFGRLLYLSSASNAMNKLGIGVASLLGEGLELSAFELSAFLLSAFKLLAVMGSVIATRNDSYSVGDCEPGRGNI